jgi:hypothetical protein
MMDEADWREFLAMLERVSDWIDERNLEIVALVDQVMALITECDPR